MADWRNQVKHVWIIGEGVPAFDFDAVFSESHTSRLAIMENPVETGVVIADHAFKLPGELEIYAMVSDVWTGMRKPDGNKITPLEDDKPWLIPSDSTDASSRSQRAWELLLALQASANPFTVVTGLISYPNKLCTELTAMQDTKTFAALKFRAVLRDVQFVNTETTTYTPRADVVTTRKASKVTTSGEQQAVAPAPEKQVSVAARAVRAVGLVR